MKRILSFIMAALVMGAMVVAMATPTLTNAQATCSEATLEGRYLFAYDGYEIRRHRNIPFSQAGYEVYDGNGRVTGVFSGNFGGKLQRNTRFRGTYTVTSDCRSTVRYTDGTRYDQYISPDGSRVDFVQTKPRRFVGGGTEVRAATPGG